MNSERKADKEYQNNEFGVKAVQSDPFRKNFFVNESPSSTFDTFKTLRNYHLHCIAVLDLKFSHLQWFALNLDKKY